jgi:peptidoglycan/LPS O-acetylase OafA/YrhL
MQYIKPLDGLRAFAVLFVIRSHWMPGNFITNAIPFGEIGVDIFFVLSGFLITSILLQNKKQLDSNEATLGSIIKNFIARRTLRIFPIYYLTIFLLYLLADKTGTNIRQDIIYYLTYTSNINFFNMGNWDGILSHLWSLAVEEQFYLLWPWVILMVKRRYLPLVFFIAAITGILSNILIVNDFSWVLTSSCFDAFAIGGFIAYDRLYKKNIIRDNLKWIASLAAIIIIAELSWGFTVLPLRTLVAVSSLCIIYLLLNKNGLSNFLSMRSLVFIGKISYGIYLYHNIIPWLWGNILGKLIKLGLPGFFANPSLVLLENFVILIGVSWLSWIIIERPINNLKRYFKYNAKDKSDTNFADPEKWISEVGRV